MSVRRVYEHPNLMREVLENCDNTTLLKALTLEKNFFPIVTSVLWRSVTFDIASHLRNDRREFYVPSIRYLDLIELAMPTEENEQRDVIVQLLEQYPQARRLTRRYTKNDSTYFWRVERIAPGRYSVDLRVRRTLDENLSTVELPDQDQWEGFELHPLVELVLAIPRHDGATPHEAELANLNHLIFGLADPGPAAPSIEEGRMRTRQAVARYVQYLSDPTKRQKEIHALDTGNLPIRFDDVATIFNAKPLSEFERDSHGGGIVDVRLRVLEDGRIDEFERFCKTVAGNRLKTFVIDSAERSFFITDSNRHFISLLDLNRAVAALAPNFPHLENLTLAISITKGRSFIPVTQIKSPGPYSSGGRAEGKMRSLRHVTITAKGHSHEMNKDRYAFPIDVVAECLAALGAGPECTYELKNSSGVFLGMDVSRQLNNAVHTLQGHKLSIKQPPKRRSLPRIPPELRSYACQSPPPNYSPT